MFETRDIYCVNCKRKGICYFWFAYFWCLDCMPFEGKRAFKLVNERHPSAAGARETMSLTNALLGSETSRAVAHYPNGDRVQVALAPDLAPDTPNFTVYRVTGPAGDLLYEGPFAEVKARYDAAGSPLYDAWQPVEGPADPYARPEQLVPISCGLCGHRHNLLEMCACGCRF